MLSEEVWADHKKIEELKRKLSHIQDIVDSFNKAFADVQYLSDCINLLKDEEGQIFVSEIEDKLKQTVNAINNLELKHLLSGKFDNFNVIMEIHPGAGGTESQDWAQMLLRMYLRWAEQNNYKAEILDLQNGDEAGIKSVTINFIGINIYGYLKSEAGVHRLVRISPFDTNKRRHTSFAAILIYPEIENDIDIEIRDDDLRIDTYRSSGAGGQHVNKVSSAVRLTHLSTGIVVACQNERSQHKNKERAMSILRSRLYDRKIKEQEVKLDGIIGNKKNIEWGSQIRSYILHPYKLVKDHRTSLEVGNADSILDGNLNGFIREYLFKNIKVK
jgi:peptide chain release factor 2